MAGERRGILRQAFSYLPVLVILVFGMLALHSSLKLLEAHDHAAAMFGESSYQDDVQMRQNWLYWSVISMGLCGFVLMVLNADKMWQLKKNNAEKRETLKLLENRLAAMEAARDGIMIIDSAGKLSFINKALCEIYSITLDRRESFMGQDWRTIFPADDLDALQQDILPDLDSKGHWMGERTLQHADGTQAYTEISITRLPDGGMIGTAQDISEKRASELEKKHLEDQFYQAQKMEAIGRLAGGIAHDFNNILAAMNGYAEFLVDDLPEGSDPHKFASNIILAGRQARELVDQMLAFSRRSENIYQVLDLLVPVKETLSMLRASLPKSIEVQSALNIEQAPVFGHATQISQLLMNLCVNAKDAMDTDDAHGVLTVAMDAYKMGKKFPIESVVCEDLPDPQDTPPIRIDDIGAGQTQLLLGQLAKGHTYIKLSVSDTGTGMSRAVMEHIFEPFFTTKPVNKGTGLGLATVHGVIVSHRGFMLIESTLGKGTTFELYFPLAEMEAIAAQKSITAVQPSHTEPQRERRILLVEDQKSVQDMMMSMLERLGYEAFCCDDGLEALELVREEPEAFDLVITDHNMPKMTGLEMIQQISLSYPAIPFILLSGYSENELHDIMGAHPSIKAIMRKPVTKDLLNDKITDIINENWQKKHAA